MSSGRRLSVLWLTARINKRRIPALIRDWTFRCVLTLLPAKRLFYCFFSSKLFLRYRLTSYHYHQFKTILQRRDFHQKTVILQSIGYRLHQLDNLFQTYLYVAYNHKDAKQCPVMQDDNQLFILKSNIFKQFLNLFCTFAAT